MYTVLGADGRLYGPVNEARICQWIAEGRLDARSKTRVGDSSNWNALGALPEFASAWATKPALAVPRPMPVDVGVPAGVLSRDYDLRIRECVRGGWMLLSSNHLRVLLGATVVWLAINILIVVAQWAMARAHWLLGFLAWGGSFVAGIPILGGMNYVVLRAIRQQRTAVTHVFAGFGRGFAQLVLAGIVQVFLLSVFLVCGGALIAAGMVSTQIAFSEAFAVRTVDMLAPWWMLLGVVCLIPAFYLSIGWTFTVPLIVDKGLWFWPAMQGSLKMVAKHWWRVLGLVFICGLTNVLGLLAGGVGVLFTVPATMGFLMHGYERLFGASNGPAEEGWAT